MSKKQEREDVILCRTPNGGKPVRIDSWKYFVVRQAIVDAMSRPIRGMSLKELPEFVTKSLGSKAAAVGDVAWYVTTIKMEMEVREELVRSKKQGRQWLSAGPNFEKSSTAND